MGGEVRGLCARVAAARLEPSLCGQCGLYHGGPYALAPLLELLQAAVGIGESCYGSTFRYFTTTTSSVPYN